MHRQWSLSSLACTNMCEEHLQSLELFVSLGSEGKVALCCFPQNTSSFWLKMSPLTIWLLSMRLISTRLPWANLICAIWLCHSGRLLVVAQSFCNDAANAEINSVQLPKEQTIVKIYQEDVKGRFIWRVKVSNLPKVWAQLVLWVAWRLH